MLPRLFAKEAFDKGFVELHIGRAGEKPGSEETPEGGCENRLSGQGAALR